MSSGFGLPALNFSSLSRLGQEFEQGVREEDKRRAVAGISVAPGQPGFLQQLGQNLLKAGDVDGAVAASRLLSADQDRQFQRETSTRDFDFRKQEADRQQGNFTTSLARQSENDKYSRIYQDRTASRQDEALSLQRQQATRKEYPEGFQPDPTNPSALRAIPGGKADPAYIGSVAAAEQAAKGGGEKALPAELGARVALSQSFLDSAPELRKQIAEGGVTGPYDAVVARTGSGAQGEVLRKIRSGSEAIVRNLTGAGMNESEAKQRVAQYEPAPFDSAATVLSKFDMLTEQLQRIEAEAYRGRGIPANRVGKNPFFEQKPAAQAAPGGPAPAAPATNRVDTMEAIPEGKRFRAPDGKVYRKVNGQAVAE